MLTRFADPLWCRKTYGSAESHASRSACKALSELHVTLGTMACWEEASQQEDVCSNEFGCKYMAVQLLL